MKKKKNSNELEKNPKILNSKSKKVYLELPQYTFHHSSSMTSFFLGRKQLVSRLKNLLFDTSSKTGVYLITGNRGVGKTSLVEAVINQTSPKIYFSPFAKYVLSTLFITVIFQYLTTHLKEMGNGYYNDHPIMIRIGIGIFVFVIYVLMGRYSLYKRKNKHYKKTINNFNWLISIWRAITAIIKELGHVSDYSIPNVGSQYYLKIASVVLTIQFFSMFLPLTHIKLFLFYFSFFCANLFWDFSDKFLIERYKQSLISEKPIVKEDKIDFYKIKISMQWWGQLVFIIIFTMIPIFVVNKDWCWILKVVFLLSLFVILFIKSEVYLRKTLYLKIAKSFPRSGEFLYDITIGYLLNKINWYREYHNYIYIKINFGHEVLKEKDVLRLITRNISTEYNKFCYSWKRMLIWRLVAFCVILLLSSLFNKYIYEKDILPLIETSTLYNASSQVCLNDTILRENFLQDNLKNVWLNYSEKYDHYGANTMDFIVLALDRTIYKTWSYIQLVPDYLEGNIHYDSKQYEPINYAFCLIFLLIYLFGCCILRIKFFNITTHRKIRQQLKDLNDAITYNIEHGENNDINIKAQINAQDFTLKRGRSVKKTRIYADEREIEKELQDILNHIQNIPEFMQRPEFIFIFDELDKVEPEEGKDYTSNYKTKGSLFSISATRDRQSTILKLLSNLKYFLTNANAKFIFIAGREMYDIYLADVSDRNNFIGSIFNDVIHVPSFLSDHPEINCTRMDPTSLTEAYVCKYLISDYYPVVSYDLENYSKYLDAISYSEVLDQKEIVMEKEVAMKKEIAMEKEKIIAILQQFILYLAHISKGAPKKLAQLFESFVETHERHDLDDKFTIKIYRHSRFFLVFNYYDQFALGTTTHLISPIIYKFANSNIQEHSDKLFVSALYFVDFLLKFHNHNFSWKNLDISPEMIEINKAPELKPIVNDLITFFTKTHIDKSISGFYEYRFGDLIAQEIAFMTKTHEGFSALFNFSLDESLALKQYYRDLLRDAQKNYSDSKGKDEKKGFINSISSLQIVLGDLHFYDDELEEAGIYYKDGVQVLRNTEDAKTMSLEQLYLLVRNMLKLGSIYEKRKQYDFAFLTYGELCKKLIEIRYFDLEVFGEYNKNGDLKFSTRSGEHRSLSIDKEKNKTNNILFKDLTFEGLKLLYLPFLAKFQILEKSHFGGIKKHSIEQLENEFDFLTKEIQIEDADILRADFYARIADILYYKNYNFKSDEKQKSNEKNMSCLACKFYKKSLLSLIKLDKSTPNNNINILEILKEGLIIIQESTNSRYCSMMAQIFSDWGNVFFSCDKKILNQEVCKCINGDKNGNSFCEIFTDSEKFNESLFSELKSFIQSKPSDEKVFISLKDSVNNIFNSKKNILKMELAAIMYAISSKLYKKANYYKRSAYQVYKLLQLIKYYHPLFKDLIRIVEPNNIINLLSKEAIRSVYISYDGLNIFEINKRKNDLEIEKVPLQNILVDSEIGRIRILVKDIELKFDKSPEKLKEYYSMYITSPYGINYSVSARMYRLRLKTIVNWEAYQVMRSEHQLFAICNLSETPMMIIEGQNIYSFLNINNQEEIDEKLEEIVLSIENRMTKEISTDFKDQLLKIKDMIKYRAEKERNESNVYVELLSILLFDINNRNINIPQTQTQKIFADYFYFENRNQTNLEILEKLIAESIFCLKEVIRLDKTIGDSYLFNHSYIASMYEKLADWTILYECYNNIKEAIKNPNKKVEDEKLKMAFNLFSNDKSLLKGILSYSQIETHLEDLLGNEWKQQLSGFYENQQAISHYYRAKETHEGGRAYFNIIDNLYYIKEDFNDRAKHFNIALERFKIQSGKIDKAIERLKKRYQKSKLYDVNNYFENETIEAVKEGSE
jgi:hypothetical protein